MDNLLLDEISEQMEQDYRRYPRPLGMEEDAL
jgi:hypothetical protein